MLAKVGSLQLGLKVPVYVYDANCRSLINNAPFDSLLDAANSKKRIFEHFKA